MAVWQKNIDPVHAADMAVFLDLIRADLNPDRIARVTGRAEPGSGKPGQVESGTGEARRVKQVTVKTGHVESGANETRLVESGTVDWEYLVSLAEKHRVLPVFYVNVKKAGLRTFIPESLYKRLFRRYADIVAYNLRLCGKLAMILSLFESRGIPAVPFKGPLLAQALYGDEVLRYYQDLDILAPEADVPAARDALSACGFLPVMHRFSGKQFRQVLKYGREWHFKDATDNIEIDLHWRLGGPFRRRFDYDFCKDRLQAIPWHGRQVHCLSAEDTLLHLCVNGAHDLWGSLEQILSVADFIDRHPDLDWGLVQMLAARLHCRRMLFLGLFLARDVFDAALPREVNDQIKKDRAVADLAAMIYGKLFGVSPRESHIEKRVGQLPFSLKMREHFLDKMMYLMRRVFVPTQKDWKNRPPDARPANFYFLSRPLNLAVELIRALRRR